MNIVGLTGKINSDIKSRMVGVFKVVTFFISVPSAGPWNKSTNKVDYGSFAVEAWGKVAETLETHCTKGTSISLSGTLKQDAWVDATTGNERERTKIVLTNFQFLNDVEKFASIQDVSESEEDSDFSFTTDPFDL